MRPAEVELRAKLIDDFSAQVLTGALSVMANPNNPIRLNQFAALLDCELRNPTTHSFLMQAEDSSHEVKRFGTVSHTEVNN
jgi:hypothetical protein